MPIVGTLPNTLTAGTDVTATALQGNFQYIADQVNANMSGSIYDTITASTGYFDLPAGTYIQRPGSPVVGNQRFNTSSGYMEYYDGSAWQNYIGIPTVTGKAIFAYGFNGTAYLSMTNLVSTTGVVAADTTGVGVIRKSVDGANYGGDKGIFAYGFNGVSSTYVNTISLISNTGVVAADSTGTGTGRSAAPASTYGYDKAIFCGGSTSAAFVNMTNLVSSTGVVATDTIGVGTARRNAAATGYGGDKAIYAFGNTSYNLGTGATSLSNLISNTGVVASDTTGVGTARMQLGGATYGGDKAIFGFGSTTNAAAGRISTLSLVSNTGVIAADTSSVGTARVSLAAAEYGFDKAIFGYGDIGSYVSVTNLVSSTGVVASDTTGVGTARNVLGATGF